MAEMKKEFYAKLPHFSGTYLSSDEKGPAMQFGFTLKPDISVERILGLTRQAEAAGFKYGWIFDSHVLWKEPYPLLKMCIRDSAWVIGVPWRDCGVIGTLLGTRMVLNELVAFSMLGPMRAALDPRSFTIATFALCGFANLSSIGIQIGGIGALAPNKKGELARLGIRAMLAGTMANLMSASIAGMLL